MGTVVRKPARLAACLAVLAGMNGACDRAQAPLDDPWFVDATTASGLVFTHYNGRTGQFYYPEVIAPGAALLDSDGDGDLDVFVIQSADFTPGDGHAPTPQSRFFRNDLRVAADGTRALKFTDATAHSGLALSGYGMGVAAGDFDNDGCVDLLATSLDGNRLLHNDCHASSPTSRCEAALPPPGGAYRRRSSTSTAMAGSTSSSGTT